MSLFDNAERLSAVIQVRRGKDVERQVKRYDVGEIIYSTDSKRLYVGDGTLSGTYGGVSVASKTWIGPNFANFSTQLGDLVYRSDAAPVGTGFYLLTGANFPKNDIRNYVLVGGDALLSRATPYNLQKASSLVLGGVKINNSPISIDGNGFLTLRTDGSLTIDNGVLKIVSTGGGSGGGSGSTTDIIAGNALTYTNETGRLDVNIQPENALKVDDSNNLYVDTVTLTNQISVSQASTTQYGIVKIKSANSGLNVSNGIISTKIATSSNLGAVAVGDSLTIDSSTGVLEVKASSQNSLADNGYQKLPGGVILQWGTFTAAGLGSWTNPQIVNLPMTFPNAIWYVGVSEDGGATVGVEFAYMDFTTAGKTTLSQIGVYTNYAGPVKFFAIGN
jgi:hypothetical protein